MDRSIHRKSSIGQLAVRQRGQSRADFAGHPAKARTRARNAGLGPRWEVGGEGIIIGCSGSGVVRQVRRKSRRRDSRSLARSRDISCRLRWPAGGRRRGGCVPGAGVRARFSPFRGFLHRRGHRAEEGARSSQGLRTSILAHNDDYPVPRPSSAFFASGLDVSIAPT